MLLFCEFAVPVSKIIMMEGTNKRQSTDNMHPKQCATSAQALRKKNIC